MTRIVVALRALLTGSPVGNEAWLAVAWWAGVAIGGYLWARAADNRRTIR
jgi:ABC-2 type transport system permease protein